MVVDSIWRVLSATSSPIALVVDDLHRADSLSLWVMRLLARRTAHYPLLILGGSRESSSQVAELAGEPRTRTIELMGLGKSEIAGLVSQLGLHPVGEVSDALYERSSGNPFFIDQLISSLRGTRRRPGGGVR
jgi:predicted ATPase